MPQFAISDIHGCKKTFESILDKIAFSKADTLFLLGDFVDRGPDSKGVIDLIWKLQQEGYQVNCIRGNHEELVLRAASSNYTLLEKWLLTDGKDTMDSFGVDNCADIPAAYIQWMNSLPYFLEVDKYILVHGGLDFTLQDPLADTTEMCWIRAWHTHINYDWLEQRIILHGHTPIEIELLESQFVNLEHQQYLDIDNGCVYAHPRHWRSDGLGSLCAFDMTNRKLYFKENIDI